MKCNRKESFLIADPQQDENEDRVKTMIKDTLADGMFRNLGDGMNVSDFLIMKPEGVARHHHVVTAAKAMVGAAYIDGGMDAVRRLMQY